MNKKAKYELKEIKFNKILNLALDYSNWKHKKFCNGKILQDFENANRNILKIIEIKSKNWDGLIKQFTNQKKNG